MKHLSHYRIRFGSLLLSLILLAGAGCHSDNHTARGPRDREEEEERAEHQTDRPDLAEAQEIALTRDPATGTVPRERLLVAKAQIARLLQARAAAQQRGTAAGGSLSAAVWTEKGPGNIAGRVLALLPDPSDASGNNLWAAAAGGGLWKSTNAAGAAPTWSKVSDTFANLAISTLAYDPTSAGFNTLYFGTGEGFGNGDAVRGLGIWKSTDHGATWSQLPSTNNSTFYFVNKIVVDRNGWVYAATSLGLRRSQDGGATWTGVAFTSNRIGDVDVNLSTGAVYFTLGPSTTGGGIYRSPSGDAGTFVNLNTLVGNGLPPTGTTTRVELALAPSNPSQLYALFCSSGSGSPAITRNTFYGVYRSADGGNTWEALPKPDDADIGITAEDFTRGQAWYDLPITVSPTDPATVFIGGIDIFKTSNGTAATASAVAWQQATHWFGGFGFQNVHADQHAIEFAPGSGTRAYFGNDGGVAATSTATNTIPTITPINNSFNVTQFYSVAVHPSDYGYFLAGAQDNGTQQFRTATGTTTRDVNGGDGAFCAIDEEQPDIQFATYVYSNVYRSRAKGDDFFPDIIEKNNNAGSFINPLEYDSKSNVLYYNYSTAAVPSQLRRALTATTTAVLSTIALPVGSGIITHVAVSPNVSNRVYVGTDQGRVLQLDDANGATPTITTIFTGTAGTSVSCIGVEQLRAGAPSPDQHILVTIANYGQTSVWQTTNGGSSWASAEGNLPDMPVRWVLPDPTGSKRALLATELGVWTTDDLYAAPVVWAPANSNLANVRVDMLRLRRTDRMVVAATHGRGLFTSNILVVNPLPVELVAFTAQATPNGTAVRLSWTTASEKNSAAFEVERSPGGTVFARVGTVAAAGSSSMLQNYELVDEHLPAGTATLYYRLRQVDRDGSFTYSPLRTVARRAAPDELAVFPNPARGSATLVGSPAGTRVQVFDELGRLVATTTTDASSTAHLVLPPALPAGGYVVRAGSRSVRLAVQ